VSNKASYIVIQLLRMKKKVSFSILLIFLYSIATAQVAVRYEPRHKVALENKWIRLLDVRLLPGDTSLFHIHEIPSFFIPLSNTAIGSQVKGQSPQESKFTVGATWYNGFENGPLIHRVWNSDTNVLHVIDLELLSGKKATRPTTVQLPNSKIDFENEKLRVYKFELASKQTILLPSLRTPMIFISLSGAELQIQNPKKKDFVYHVNAGGFQWLEPGQRFAINNKEIIGANAILILFK
jgi:hypothetical protein